MNIKKIKKINDKYQIIFENKEKLVTYDDILIKYNILYKKDIDNELYEQLIKENCYYELYNKTINLISKRIRCEKEIIQYLKKYTDNLEYINKIVDSLKEKRILDDNMFASSYMQDKIYLSNYGPYAIKKQLLDFNIDEDVIDNLIDKLDNEYIETKLDKIITKKLKDTKHSVYYIKQKVINDLYNLGYSKELIIHLLDNHEIKSNIQGEYNSIYNKLSKKYQGHELDEKVKSKLYSKGYNTSEINSIKKTD